MPVFQSLHSLCGTMPEELNQIGYRSYPAYCNLEPLSYSNAPQTALPTSTKYISRSPLPLAWIFPLYVSAYKSFIKSWV